MKTIGLLGGMSWESTATYYQLINRAVKRQLGGLHSAEINLQSVDFAEIERLQHQGDWQSLKDILIHRARLLESGGADCCVICTNTMHKVAPAIAKEIGIPLIHIADSTASKLKSARIKQVALLGTRFTMEEDFYIKRLTGRGVEVIVPEMTERQQVHDIIYNELCRGQIVESSRSLYKRVIEGVEARGAQAVILGCTEIGLLVRTQDSRLPLFDTTQIHADAAVDFALS